MKNVVTFLISENRPHEAAQGFDPVEVCPLLFTTRLSTVRMLIELEEWDKAVQVLDGLTEEDDEIVDVWYLLGWVNKLRSEQEQDDMYLGNSRHFLTKAKEVNVKNPTKDKEMIAHIDELLKELGPDTEIEEVKNGDNGNEWEDLEDSSEDEEEEQNGKNVNGMEQS